MYTWAWAHTEQKRFWYLHVIHIDTDLLGFLLLLPHNPSFSNVLTITDQP